MSCLPLLLFLLRATAATERRGEGAKPGLEKVYRQTADSLTECRNTWSCRNEQELIQRARHVGHRRGTMYIHRGYTEALVTTDGEATLLLLTDPQVILPAGHDETRRCL